MRLTEYLKLRHQSKQSIARALGIHRMTLYRMLKRPTKMFILAIEYLTAGEVSRNDWGQNEA